MGPTSFATCARSLHGYLVTSVLVTVDPYTWHAAFAVARGIALLATGRERSNRPLIVRPGGLGDLVTATAALEDLGFAPSSMDWVIERRSALWAEYLGLPHRCYDRSPRRWFDGLGARTLCIDTEQRYGLSAAFARLLTHSDGALYGFSTNRAAAMHTRAIPYDPFDMHELHAFQALFAEALGATHHPAPLRARSAPAAEHVVVAIAGTNHPSRRWQADEWAAMVRRFVDAPRILLTAAPGDRQLAHDTAARMSVRCEVLDGTWSEVCTAVKSAQRVFTIDSGMVHVASYFGVPVDAVFTAGRDAKWRPWSRGSRVIKRTDLPCQPCTRFGAVPECRFQYRCKQMDRWDIIPVE